MSSDQGQQMSGKKKTELPIPYEKNQKGYPKLEDTMHNKLILTLLSLGKKNTKEHCKTSTNMVFMVSSQVTQHSHWCFPQSSVL